MERALDLAPVAFLVMGHRADQAELSHSWQAVLALGGQPALVSSSGGEVGLFRGPVPAGSMQPDVELPDADAAGFAGLVLAGGQYRAAGAGGQPGAVVFVRAFVKAGLPVAAIGGAAGILIAAGGVAGRRLTSAPSLRTELAAAGASWADERVVVCEQRPGVLVTAQDRSDLPAFCRAFTRSFFCRP